MKNLRNVLVIVGLMLASVTASAQYTGARPYSGQFGYHSNSPDDAEIQFTNESSYPMVVALISNGIVVDHAYIGQYQTYTFDGLPAGYYQYKAEVRDGGSANEYISGNTTFDIIDNICPEGYTCSGRNYQTIRVYYTVSRGGTNVRNISKSEFFN